MVDSFARILGKVFVKGSGSGVSDLEVVLYDMDAPGQEGSTRPDDNLDGLYRDALSRSWIDFPGDRLGSVLTDDKGRFLLQYDLQDFQIRNSEKRPDLVLLVLAPDEAMKPGSPAGKPPGQRLVHYAWVPRANSGRVESYSIALDPARLDAFGVGYRGSQPSPQARANQIEQAILQSQDLKTRSRAFVKAQVEGKATHIQAYERMQAQSWRWLMPMRIAPGGALIFKPPTEPLDAHSARAAHAGVSRMAEMRPQAKLWLTDAELERMGLRPLDLNSGTPRPVSFCDAMAMKGFGRELVRVKSLLDEVRRRRDAEGRLDPPGETPGPLPAEGPVLPDPAGAAGFLGQRILGQVQDLPGLENKKSGSAIGELQKVKETINQLELSGGPANVTAFQDFHSLQIAFKDVWTAAFDQRLKEQALDLYKETVKLHEEYGLSVPDMDAIENVNDFRAFLNGLRGREEFAEVLPIEPEVRDCYPQLTHSTWNRLDDDGRAALRTAAYNYKYGFSDITTDPWYESREYLDGQYAKVMKYHMTSPLARVEKLMLDLSDRLTEPYAFHYFAPDSVNYGVLLTYRQEWQPETYQVGRLVATIPLAPGEKRSFKVSQSRKQTRAEKAVEKSMLERSMGDKSTSRAEMEVMAKVAVTSNFRMSAQGTFNIGVGSIGTTTEFGMNQQQESTSTKRAFNEAIREAAEKVRQEREISVDETQEAQFSSEATHEISNPNNELTVTYLLYELERRYSVQTRLHKVTPVIMVALDMPAPHEITETWILEHAWILRRCLLDDQFGPAIAYIEDGLSADDMRLELNESNWKTQKQLVTDLEAALDDLKRIREGRRASLVNLTEARERASAGESDADDVAAAIFSGGWSLLFPETNPDRSPLLEAQRKSVEKMLEYTEQQLTETQERLSRTREDLQKATDAYSKALGDKSRKDSQISQFKLHIRQNILHYMHGVYDYMHPDQLFLSLYHKEVPFLPAPERSCTLRPATAGERAGGVPGVVREGRLYIAECAPPAAPDPRVPLPKRPLVEIAELTRPLGFKGNYIIFPLKECSHLTDFMAQGFVDDYLGVRDPGLEDGYSVKDLLDYAAAVIHDPAVILSDADASALRALVLRKLSHVGVESETLVLPTGQLYMEALKGEQALLEDFKLAHRGLDVLGAQEDVRRQRLDNLARAQRQTQDPPQLDHYHPEKVILIKGDTGRIGIPSGDI